MLKLNILLGLSKSRLKSISMLKAGPILIEFMDEEIWSDIGGLVWPRWEGLLK